MKRMTAICLLSTLLTSQACSAEIANTQVPPPNGTEVNRNEQRRDVNENANRTNAQSESQTVQADKSSIKDTKGLIVLSNKYGKNDFVRFYNDDGSLWYEFTFYYDDSDGKFEYENEEFGPFSFHQDYFVLALRCVGEDKYRYEVIVNEENGLKKFVKKDDPTLKFETLGEHITKVFAIEFDRVKNPLLEAPNGKVRNIDLSPELIFHPVEVRGEWLKVRWDGSQQPKKDAGSGWVKWRDDNQILVELFYFA
ncbi:MAG: hypothetical protein IPN69_17370 [Acidobacteria bacterium]|nr:hypothetical protein [Acidobacteriota bacterium]